MGSGREMDGCGQCIKYTMFFANVIIFLGGVVVLGVGVWTLLDKAYITNLLGSNLFLGAVYILIGTGGLVALIAFLGCLGAVKEVKCMLVTYFMIIFILFVTMLVGGILGYVFREDVRMNLDKGMRNSITQYNQSPTIREAWDETQTVLQCCGIEGPADWKGAVPESCCKEGPNDKDLLLDMMMAMLRVTLKRPDYNDPPITQSKDPLDSLMKSILKLTMVQQSRNRTKKKAPSSNKLPCRTFQTTVNSHTNGCLTTLKDYIVENSTVLAGTGIGVSSLMSQRCNQSSAYQNGCLDSAENLIRDNASVLGATGIGVACLMLLGMIFSCVLFKMI